MKKTFFTLMLILLGLNFVKSQVWVQPGAVWHYDYWFPGVGGFLKMEYEKDTLIQGRVCQKITTLDYKFMHNQYGQTILLGPHKNADQFTSVSGDTVFWWSNNDFFVLYNFGASIGDNWIVSLVNPGGLSAKCDDTSRLFVTDTGSMVLNSVRYRTITVEPSPNASIGIKGVIVERFGLVNTDWGEFQTLFPYGYQCDSLAAVVDWGWFRFKCFQDNAFPLYNPFTEGCEHLLTTIGMEEPEFLPVKLYPNPTSGLLMIHTPGHPEKMAEVYNFQGAMVKTLVLRDEVSSIDLSDLPKGIYWIVLQTHLSQRQSFKVIRE
jgi:hypothetical protein